MKNIRIEIKWTLIFAVMMLLWMVLERMVGLHDERIHLHPVLTNFVAIPAIAIYVLALREKKRKHYGGVMNFQQGTIAGMIMTGIIALLTPALQYVISVYITPEFFNNVIAYSIKNGEMTEADARYYFNLKSYMIQATIGALVMGSLTTLAVATVLKTKQKAG